MTTTPNEPGQDPEVVPSGDPSPTHTEPETPGEAPNDPASDPAEPHGDPLIQPNSSDEGWGVTTRPREPPPGPEDDQPAEGESGAVAQAPTAPHEAPGVAPPEDDSGEPLSDPTQLAE